MQSIITGKAYVLGDNIDTDQIIPAQYLSFNPAIPEERKYFGMYANSGVPDGQQGLPGGNERFVPEGAFTSQYTVIIGMCREGYANELLSRKAIIVDVNELAVEDLDEATRVIDYLSGVAEAVAGSIYEIAKNIFIFAPSNVSLDGDPLKQVEVY